MKLNQNKPFRFIVVDDVSAECFYLKTLLEQLYEGCSVEIFNDGKSAINRIQKNNFDIVITDVNLSENGTFNGWSVMESAYYAGKPVIIISGISLLQRYPLITKYRNFDKSMIKFVPKPIHKNVLYEKIENIKNQGFSETTVLRRLTENLKLITN